MTEREKMVAGQWYCCVDPELDKLRMHARSAVHAHNVAPPETRVGMVPQLQKLLGHVGNDVLLEAPFHCAYGINIHLDDGVYINAGCTILDTASVRIGANTMFGPSVHIYCAEHHKDVDKRTEGLERAIPVTIGKKVWIGGGAIILPGVTIGDGAIVGAGSIVTRDVSPGHTVVGNPARPIGR